MKKMIFAGVCLLFFIQGLLRAQEGQAPKPPAGGACAGYNVIWVSFDALQAAHVSALGYPRRTTPTIDRFAAEGFLFKNAVSQAPWTVPSTMSWFTSLYPSQHKLVNKYSTYTQEEKVLSNLKQLSPGVRTLAEILKQNGYVTGAFTGDAGVSAIFGFGEGFGKFFEGAKFGGMDRSIPEAVAWLKENKDKKFFLFLHGYDVHGQYDPPAGFTREFVDPSYRGPFKGGKEEQGLLREEGLEKGSISLTDEDVRFWRALYDEKIKDADERFAQFIEEVKKLGVLDKTILVLVSDHGTEFYEHGRFDHGFTLYDELIRVPLVIWLPKAEAGKMIEDQVRGIDIMPTLLDLLGIKVLKDVKDQMKGVSLLPLLRGGHLDLEAFSETDYRFYAHKRSVRTPDGWKFIYSLDTKKKELYNIKNDPGERENLVDKEPRVAYELEQKLFAWMKSMGQDEHYYEKLMGRVFGLKIKEY